MQRLVVFFFIVGFSFSTLSAQDYFKELRNGRESLDSLIERIDSVDVDAVQPSIFAELRGALNRLGAAQTELSLLTLMGWFLDVGLQEDTVDEQALIICAEGLVERLELLFNQEMTMQALRGWIIHEMEHFLDHDTLNLERMRMTTALQALEQRALTRVPEGNEVLTRFPDDVEVFFESYRTYGGSFPAVYVHLIHSVAQSLFNLSVELAFSATQDPFTSSLYDSLMGVVRQLYTLIGMQLPGVGTLQLSPRTLAQLNQNDSETGSAQHRSPRRGSLSPEDNFGVRRQQTLLCLGDPDAIYIHRRVASTGHSVLGFQMYSQ